MRDAARGRATFRASLFLAALAVGGGPALGSLGGAPAPGPLGGIRPATAQEPGELYRRSPLIGGDPFAHLTEGRRSLALTSRASGGNNTLDLDHLGAILFLAERDSLRPADALDALGLVPRGEGLTGYGNGGARLRLGLPVSRSVTVGVGLAGRGFGSFRLDDDAVALLRDGNGARSEFSLGETRADGLLAAELGVHGVWRPEGRPGPGGSRLAVGAGLRLVEPLFYGRALSVLEDRSRILVSPDSVRARASVASARTPTVAGQGSGFLADLMARLEWPRRGVAVEGMVRDLGRVSLHGLVLRREDVDLSTTRLDSVVDVMEGLSLTVRDTVTASVSPPVQVGLTASVRRHLPVRLDGRLLVAVGGSFDRPPPSGELLSTWRPGPSLPVRVGLRMGGRSGAGLRLGLGWETGRFFVRGSAVSHAGFAGAARGLAATFDAGLWF